MSLKPFDVFSYGMVAASTLYTVRGAFPAAEGYAEIEDVQHMAGGEATNASIVLARLGTQVKLDGNWLGADKSGQRTKALLSQFNIDTSRLPLRDGYRGARETVFAAQDSRTIFGNYGRLQEEQAWNSADPDDIFQSKVVCLDPFFGQASLRVAQAACDRGIPVVTVDCRHDDPLLKSTSAVVIAESFLKENYSSRGLEALFLEYQAATAALVIFTFGDAPAWYAQPHESYKLCFPYAIDAVDTTGGGDSFRAGVVYGMLNKWHPDKTVDFAAAIAAINCTRSPGVINSPSREEVVRFMKTQKRSR